VGRGDHLTCSFTRSVGGSHRAWKVALSRVLCAQSEVGLVMKMASAYRLEADAWKGWESRSTVSFWGKV
jgi:hypothetical protein